MCRFSYVGDAVLCYCWMCPLVKYSGMYETFVDRERGRWELVEFVSTVELDIMFWHICIYL